MSKKKRLLLDMDAIITDINTPAIEMYNDYYGTKLDVSKAINYFSGYEIFTDQIVRADLEHIFAEPGFFFSLDPMKDAIEEINNLNEIYDIHIVTKPFTKSSTCLQDKTEWIREYLPFLETKMNLVFNKEIINGDILIDDDDRNIKKWKMEHPQGKVGTIVHPWSKVEIFDIKAKDWKELSRILSLMAS